MPDEVKRWWIVVIALLSGIGGLGGAVAGLAAANSSVAPLTRDLEPVIIKGAAVAAFDGIPVDQLFVYVRSENTWQQIPAQVDEVTVTGWYTTTEDGRLDANDEVVFMARDLGERAAGGGPEEAGRLINPRWYEIEVTDPTRPNQKGWAYLVHSATLRPTFTEDYVNFDADRHQIDARQYHLGFGQVHLGMEYLALGDDPMDLLDRTKLDLYCEINLDLPISCPLTEDSLPVTWPDGLMRDGPVRVVARGGRVLAYASMLRWKSTFFIPRAIAGDIRFTADFSEAVMGSTLYNALLPAGVTVDGVPDSVPAEPWSPWWQLSTSRGTIIQVTDVSPPGETQTNAYQDDATLDRSDRGDRRHYGEIGLYVTNPDRSFVYDAVTYYLPGTQPNLGETYLTYTRQPLVVTTQLQQIDLPVRVYLPAIRR